MNTVSEDGWWWSVDVRAVTNGSAGVAPVAGVCATAAMLASTATGVHPVGMRGDRPTRPIRPTARPSRERAIGAGRIGRAPIAADAVSRTNRHASTGKISLCVLHAGTAGARTGEVA